MDLKKWLDTIENQIDVRINILENDVIRYNKAKNHLINSIKRNKEIKQESLILTNEQITKESNIKDDSISKLDNILNMAKEARLSVQTNKTKSLTESKTNESIISSTSTALRKDKNQTIKTVKSSIIRKEKLPNSKTKINQIVKSELKNELFNLPIDFNSIIKQVIIDLNNFYRNKSIKRLTITYEKELLKYKLRFYKSIYKEFSLPPNEYFNSIRKHTPDILISNNNSKEYSNSIIKFINHFEIKYDKLLKSKVKNLNFNEYDIDDKKEIIKLWYQMRLIHSHYQDSYKEIGDSNKISKLDNSKNFEELLFVAPLTVPQLINTLIYPTSNSNIIQCFSSKKFLLESEKTINQYMHIYSNRVKYFTESIIAKYLLKLLIHYLKSYSQTNNTDRKEWIEILKSYRNLYSCLLHGGEKINNCKFFEKS